MTKGRVVIVPGNGGGDVEHANWYGWLREKLIEVSSKARYFYFESLLINLIN